MYIALAILLIMHGVAHLVGFLSPFGLLQDAKPLSSVLGGSVTLGSTGMRAFGILWLIAALLFMIAAYGVIRRTDWWQPFTIWTAVFSLGLTVLFMPQSVFGAVINGALLTLIFMNKSHHWLAPRV